jgi:hypothetical protein
MRGTRFRGTSPPSPRDAVCGFGGDRFIIPQGLAHARAGVGCEYSFFQSKKNCQSFLLARSKRRNKAPVASDIISTRSAT